MVIGIGRVHGQLRRLRPGTRQLRARSAGDSGAGESPTARETWNPTYELAYWRMGSGDRRSDGGTAAAGAANQMGRGLRKKLAPLPVAGRRLPGARELPADLHAERNGSSRRCSRPTACCPTPVIDRDDHARTLDKVMQGVALETTWGWDYPMVAMTAARLGEREDGGRCPAPRHAEEPLAAQRSQLPASQSAAVSARATAVCCWPSG